MEGPLFKKEDWNKRLIPKSINEKLGEHGLKGTFTPENPIPADDGLADSFWKAGFELAVDVGALCVETERVIKFTKDELLARLKSLPTEVHMGSGLDEAIWRVRGVEDTKPLGTNLGPFGMEVSPEYAVPINASSAQHRVIDFLTWGYVSEAQGIKSRTRYPIEMLVGAHQAQVVEAVLKMVYRPGMVRAIGGITDIMAYGWLVGTLSRGTPIVSDPHLFLPLPGSCELKVGHSMMNLAAFAHILSAVTSSYIHPMLGGFAGGAEGCALCRIASIILLPSVTKSSFNNSSVFDSRYLGNCGRESIWANSVSSQAVNRNSGGLMLGEIINPVAGPDTEMLLQELGVGVLNAVVDGATWIVGVRSGGGKYTDYSTGLENYFAGEIAKFVPRTKLKREDVNEIVKKIMPLYEDKLRNPPKGSSFPECYDVVRLVPSKDWDEKYIKVKKEFEDLGISFEITK